MGGIVQTLQSAYEDPLGALSTHSESIIVLPSKVGLCPPAVYTEPSPSTCHFRKLIWLRRYRLTSRSLRPLRRVQVILLVPEKTRLRAGGRNVSFPDETGLPGHQLPCSEGRSDKEPNLNSCNVAVCNIEYLRHLLKVWHYKWMERIQECFIRWELLSGRCVFQGRILIRHYLYL